MKRPRSAAELSPGTQLTNAHTHLCFSQAECWLEYYRSKANGLYWYGMLSGFLTSSILIGLLVSIIF